MTWPQYLRHECTAWGFRVRLSRLQTAVLAVLLMRFPAPVPVADIVEATWPDEEPDNSITRVAELIGELRRKLGGFHIIARPGFGYQLQQARTAS